MIHMSKKAPNDSVGMSSDVNSLEIAGITKRRVGEGGINKRVINDVSLAAFAVEELVEEIFLDLKKSDGE